VHHRIFESVKLNSIELRGGDNARDLGRILVDEDAEAQHVRRKIANEPPRLIGAETPGTFREDEPHRIDAQLDRSLEILPARNSAQFDPGPPLHRSSRMLDPSRG
jgi:hypothetical protein